MIFYVSFVHRTERSKNKTKEEENEGQDHMVTIAIEDDGNAASVKAHGLLTPLGLRKRKSDEKKGEKATSNGWKGLLLTLQKKIIHGQNSLKLVGVERKIESDDANGPWQ